MKHSAVLIGFLFWVATLASAQPETGRPPFNLIEATIPQMQAAMAEGRTTSRAIVEGYLRRIALHNDRLKAALAINSQAVDEADVLDRERASGKVRGPLHGIPIALKDNIQTLVMPTTAGTLALKDFVAPYEATLTRNLREAGAIIIAKANMMELAAFKGNGSAHNALTGYYMNPYDPRPDPRPSGAEGRPVLTPGGSSSGTGTAANLWAASVGTETFVSIIAPSHYTMLVGIKPTVGRISRYGIVPVSLDRDTAGPMARTVTDAAILLGVMEGAARDSRDPGSAVAEGLPRGNYMQSLKADALRGARIGVPRAFFYEPVTPPGGEKAVGGISLEEAALMAEVIAVLKQQGAVIVDPADLPCIITTDRENNWNLWPFFALRSSPNWREKNDASIALQYAMKRDFNRWLKSVGAAAPFRSLTELREWNLAHKDAALGKGDQSRLDRSDEIDLEKDRPRYEHDRDKDFRLSRDEGIDAVMKLHRLDALLFPNFAASLVACRAGYPVITVPFGTVKNTPPAAAPFPVDFQARASPYGISFTASRNADARLIEIAFAFEQATKRRTAPDPIP